MVDAPSAVSFIDTKIPRDSIIDGVTTSCDWLTTLEASLTSSENTPDEKTEKWSSGPSVERMHAQVLPGFQFELFLLGDSLIGPDGESA